MVERFRRYLAQHYMLVLLTAILASNYIDRIALGFLVQDIKVDLNLSDTQLGFMSGLAFAIFYSVMGIPIARWADRGNRVSIVTITTGLWGIGVALCGAASTFIQLLFVRIFVAVGEAGCQPPALSLISDKYSREERPRATARYMLGLPIALVVGSLMAGWLNQYFGWRATFVIIALPGVVLAAVAYFTLRDPRSTTVEQGEIETASNDDAGSSASVSETLSMLFQNPSYRHLLFGFSITSFFAYGILQWQPAFFLRSHGLTSGELGTWFAVIFGVGGILGTIAGGELATRLAPRDESRQLAAIGVLYAGLAFAKAGVYLFDSVHLALLALTIASVGGAAANGPLFSATQTLVDPRMRAMSIAVILFSSNLIGMGLGPLAAGALSDMLNPNYGDESLRISLLMLCPGYLWAAWHIWRAGKAANRSISDGEALALKSTRMIPGEGNQNGP